jgi:hypothetical protein
MRHRFSECKSILLPLTFPRQAQPSRQPWNEISITWVEFLYSLAIILPACKGKPSSLIMNHPHRQLPHFPPQQEASQNKWLTEKGLTGFQKEEL